MHLATPAATVLASANLHDIGASALTLLRADMLRFAQLRLRNTETAEDVVQASIEAALRNSASFAGRSILKPWDFAILRHRIVDHVRQAKHAVPMSSLVDDGDDWQERVEILLAVSSLKRGRGHDESRPLARSDPKERIHSQQFRAVFEACLGHLSASTASVFKMRECLGLDTGEICVQLGITMSNCHVRLHRARLQLRGCMDSGWGRPEGSNCCAECK